MTITDWAQSHRRSILFLLGILVVGGATGSLRLPVGLFPHVDFPRVVVSLDAGDRPADRMAIEVTWPIEEAVRAVPGVRSVRSTTSRGSAEISVNFNWGEDMVAAMLQVESAMSQIANRLPPGTTHLVRRMDPTVFPVLAYSLTSDIRSLVALRDVAFYQIRPRLSTVTGVAKVGVLGGRQEEYRVTVVPALASSLGLSLEDVANALSGSNVITALGRLEDHAKLYLIVSDTHFTSLEEIRNTILRSSAAGVVLIEDVATVSLETKPEWTRVTADGHDAVIFQIYQQPGGNTVQIARDVKAELAAVQAQLPEGIRIANWYDQSELILSSAGSVRDAVVIGAVLAALILLLFLRNAKVTFIAVIAVPGVLAATVVLLSVLHMSFNIMTLGGMAAAVALIIDDNIVMLEHIIRRLRGGSGNHRLRVIQAAREFSKPLAGSSAATIVIFAPLTFLTGVTGVFFNALSVTMATSLCISFLVAWLAVPLVADHLLTEKDATQKEGGAVTNWIHRQYEHLMIRLLRRPLLVLPLITGLLVAGWIAYRHVGTGFMPAMDEGGFILDYRAPAGTSLSETDRLLREVETILDSTPDVQTYSRRTGLALGGGLTEANEGDFFVRLRPFPRQPIETVMDTVRKRVERSVPGLEIEMAQLMEDLIGDLTAVPQPIEIKLFSDDGKVLRKLAPQVATAIKAIPSVVDVKDGIVLAGDALDIKVDRERASLEGLDPESVTGLLADFASGTVTTNVQSGPKMIGVRVWTPSDDLATRTELTRLRLMTPDRRLVPLGRIATLTEVVGEPQIMRENLKRMVAVTARISGRDMGSVVRDVRFALSRPGLLPSGVYFRLGGLYEQQQAAFNGLIIVFAAAVLLVFLLLLFLYERIRVALAILTLPLMAASAVFVGLWLTDIEMNISAMMGATMIVGIVTEVAIFYVSELYDAPEITREAFIDAGRNRMRPIAMTTAAAILALMPLALAIGRGAAMQQPLAVAIVSGLLVQAPLVLIVLPVLLDVLRFRRP